MSDTTNDRTITLTIPRTDVETSWQLWVKPGTGTHAVLMDRAPGVTVWIETSESIARQYAREHGSDRVAMIVSANPWLVKNRRAVLTFRHEGTTEHTTMLSKVYNCYILSDGEAIDDLLNLADHRPVEYVVTFHSLPVS